MIARLARTIFSIALVLGSLITFPAAIPAMIAVWVAVAAAYVLIGKPVAIPVVTVVAIVLAKNIFWPASIVVFLLFATAFAARSIVLVRRTEPPPRSRIRRELLGGLGVLGLLVVWIAADWRHGSRASLGRTPVQDRVIVCLGDSLTAGGFPLVLRDRLNIPVVDFGREGITSSDALAIVQGDEFWETQPQTLVLEIGGHDYNQGGSRIRLAANLRAIIDCCREREVAVVLVETPRGFITDPFGGIERQLARTYDLELVPDTPIRQFVFLGPLIPPGVWLPKSWQLSDDGLHPNAIGNRVFADYVQKALLRLHGSEILIR